MITELTQEQAQKIVETLEEFFPFLNVANSEDCDELRAADIKSRLIDVYFTCMAISGDKGPRVAGNDELWGSKL